MRPGASLGTFLPLSHGLDEYVAPSVLRHAAPGATGVGCPVAVGADDVRPGRPDLGSLKDLSDALGRERRDEGRAVGADKIQ